MKRIFETLLCADLGSAFTRLDSRSEVSVNETRAATDPKSSQRVLAVGNASRKLLGAGEVYPVRGGIADISLAALILRRLSLDHLKRRSLMGVSLLLAVPSAVSRLEKEAALEAGREAGFRRVRLADSLLSGAIGAGLDPESHRAHMIVDIGRERLGCALIANGGIVFESVTHTGSVCVDRHIRAYFAEEHRLLVTARTAEKLKRSLASPCCEVSCRDCSSGMPTTRRVRSSELRSAAGFSIGLMCSDIVRSINAAPPDAASDLCDTGITLIGGGALQYGLAEELERRLGLRVSVSPNAEISTVTGLKPCFEAAGESRIFDSNMGLGA